MYGKLYAKGDSDPFYRPFYIMTVKSQVKQDDLNFSISYDIKSETITLIDIGNDSTTPNYYKTVYNLLNGTEYENIYTQNNLKYDEDMSVYFAEMNQALEFELPTIK